MLRAHGRALVLAQAVQRRELQRLLLPLLALFLNMGALLKRQCRFGSPAYLPNKLMASSASTPPVIEIGAKGDFAAISAQGTMIWLILVASWSTDAA